MTGDCGCGTWMSMYVSICTCIRVFNISVVDLSNGDDVCPCMSWVTACGCPCDSAHPSVCVCGRDYVCVSVICKAVSMSRPPLVVAAFF